jgi:hypothetical protein
MKYNIVIIMMRLFKIEYIKIYIVDHIVFVYHKNNIRNKYITCGKYKK